jgi:hypothetical protein
MIVIRYMVEEYTFPIFVPDFLVNLEYLFLYFYLLILFINLKIKESNVPEIVVVSFKEDL